MNSTETDNDFNFGTPFSQLESNEKVLFIDVLKRNREWVVFKLGDDVFRKRTIVEINNEKTVNSPLGIKYIKEVGKIKQEKILPQIEIILNNAGHIADTSCLCGYNFEYLLYDKDSEIIIMMDCFNDRIWVYMELFGKWVKIRNTDGHKKEKNIVYEIYRGMSLDTYFFK